MAEKHAERMSRIWIEPDEDIFTVRAVSDGAMLAIFGTAEQTEKWLAQHYNYTGKYYEAI